MSVNEDDLRALEYETKAIERDIKRIELTRQKRPVIFRIPVILAIVPLLPSVLGNFYQSRELVDAEARLAETSDQVDQKRSELTQVQAELEALENESNLVRLSHRELKDNLTDGNSRLEELKIAVAKLESEKGILEEEVAEYEHLIQQSNSSDTIAKAREIKSEFNKRIDDDIARQIRRLPTEHITFYKNIEDVGTIDLGGAIGTVVITPESEKYLTESQLDQVRATRKTP